MSHSNMSVKVAAFPTKAVIPSCAQISQQTQNTQESVMHFSCQVHSYFLVVLKAKEEMSQVEEGLDWTG